MSEQNTIQYQSRLNHTGDRPMPTDILCYLEPEIGSRIMHEVLNKYFPAFKFILDTQQSTWTAIYITSKVDDDKLAEIREFARKQLKSITEETNKA